MSKPIDLSLCNETKEECNIRSVDNNGQIVNNCSHLLRIAYALKYCELLLSKQGGDKNSRCLFIAFCANYKACLDDYIHLICAHSDMDSLNMISNDLKETHRFKVCGDIKECKWTEGHYKNRAISDKNDDYDFYIDLFDTIHFYLFHLELFGLRISIKDDHHNNMKELDYNYVDKQIDFIQNKIATGRRKLMKLKNLNTDRLNIKINSKFNISIKQQKHNIHQTKNNEGKTFIDEMFSYINKNRQNPMWLKQYIENEEYDTDAIMQDVDNILINVHNGAEYTQLIQTFIQKHNVSSNSFSTGLVFWYWNRYKHNDKKNNFRNHSYHHLFVSAHYRSLKIETLECRFITIYQYNKLIKQKANKYMKTNKCKKMKCITFSNDPLYFGISRDYPLQQSHIEALILCSDFTEFYADFTSTFYPVSNDEKHINEIKKRHSKYHHIAKCLRELIQYYGVKGDYGYKRGKTGPFYTAISNVTNIAAFSIPLNGPISTTKQKAIGIRFTNPHGMLMELNNKSAISQKEIFFDCSWISSYPEEDEHIIFGGRFKLEIETLIIMNTKKNYRQYMKAFYLFDCMISGCWPDDGYTEVTDVDVKIIQSSIDNYLQKQANNLDPYINDTFNLFCRTKTEIMLNLDEMYRFVNNETFVSLIMYPMQNQWDYPNIGDDKTNLFKEILFKLFPNIKEITMNTTGAKTYALKIDKLLSIIDNRLLLPESFERIIIKDNEYIGNNKWINHAYKSQKQFKARNDINIQLKQNRLIMEKRKSTYSRSRKLKINASATTMTNNTKKMSSKPSPITITPASTESAGNGFNEREYNKKLATLDQEEFCEWVMKCVENHTSSKTVKTMMEKIMKNQLSGRQLIKYVDKHGKKLKDFIQDKLECNEIYFLQYLAGKITDDYQNGKVPFENWNPTQFADYVEMESQSFPADAFRNDRIDGYKYCEKDDKFLLAFLGKQCGFREDVAHQLITHIDKYPGEPSKKINSNNPRYSPYNKLVGDSNKSASYKSHALTAGNRSRSYGVGSYRYHESIDDAQSDAEINELSVSYSVNPRLPGNFESPEKLFADHSVKIYERENKKHWKRIRERLHKVGIENVLYHMKNNFNENDDEKKSNEIQKKKQKKPKQCVDEQWFRKQAKLVYKIDVDRFYQELYIDIKNETLQFDTSFNKRQACEWIIYYEMNKLRDIIITYKITKKRFEKQMGGNKDDVFCKQYMGFLPKKRRKVLWKKLKKDISKGKLDYI